MGCKVFAFANQKGGVGKTTSCVNIAAGLAFAKKRVLLIDLDPQGNATMGSGVDKILAHPTVNEVLLGSNTMKESIVGPTAANYDVLPANGDLTEAEVSLARSDSKNAHEILKSAISGIASEYDFILLDCPPSLNMLTVNAMVASTSVIIPMQCEYYALEGLTALLGTMEQIQNSVNKDLYLEGILLTMYDPRNRLALDVAAQLKEHFVGKVFKTPIPRNVRLAEAPSHGVPILIYDRGSKGAGAYLAVAGELVRKHKTIALKAKAAPSLEATAEFVA
ncbi:MAG: ParA family protein [Francisellaceae bacterium]|nr:ParA family protein [Francisellaceae bacterium]MBT6538555.1 ParA family protein [Francisellaceae bacterium]